MIAFWTQEAEETFALNILYLQEEWNESVTDNFIDETLKAVSYIELNPRIYPIVNKPKKIHKCLVTKQVSLYYKITETGIDLIRFNNNYQDPKKLKFK